ncbi:hypothetical protein A9X61_04570 [Enterobacter asburiae]|uniref:hypothetical protein n=1 Tax=Vibrio parahaemolyticus TaxID=670 RepID=UPI0008016139|nr:hypothetical protein [Vibrio parahaemolyticus]OAZ97263.1 hypothetical protein A9X61_04570 [Enterobacter asburiae]WAG36326.1 hypothetical protein JK088_24760 [Vibrio parahaemolyticus]
MIFKVDGIIVGSGNHSQSGILLRWYAEDAVSSETFGSAQNYELFCISNLFSMRVRPHDGHIPSFIA